MTTSNDSPEPPTDVDALLKQWQEASLNSGDDAFWGPEPRSRWSADTIRERVTAASARRVAAILVGVFVAVLLAVAVVGSIRGQTEETLSTDVDALRAPSAQPHPAPSGPSRPQETTVNWLAVLRSVDHAREMAWENHDPALLRAVFATKGPALRRETAVVEQMGADGVDIRGWRATVKGVSEQAAAGADRTLLVTDRRSDYRWRIGDGPWQVVPAAGTRHWRVTMRSLADVWLVWEVKPTTA